MVEHSLWASYVIKGLYLGDISSTKNLPSQVTHVITLLSEKPRLPPSDKERKHFFIAAGDRESQDLLSIFPACYKFIQKALAENSTNKVLIHCRAGRSRSPTIVIMYLMRAYQWNYEKAENYLKERRPIISINDGFKKQLKIFDGLLKKCKWDKDCSCSICQSEFGRFKPQEPLKKNENIQKSSSYENFFTIPASRIKRSPSFELNFESEPPPPIMISTVTTYVPNVAPHVRILPTHRVHYQPVQRIFMTPVPC